MLRALRTSSLFLIVVLSSFPAFAVQTGSGSVSLTGAGATENFDTLASSGTSSSLPAGWYLNETGTNANGVYTAGTGGANSGDTYSFGTTTERAFGALRSGSLVPTLGAQFTNNSGVTIGTLVIAYTGEQWRAGVTNRGAADRLDFQLSADATSLTTGTWADSNALDFNSPNLAATAGALDGNAVLNRTAISGSISGLNIPPGASFWIRWTDFDISSSDDGLAIDDFQIALVEAPPQTNPTASGSASPAAVEVGQTTTLTVNVTPGANPTSTGLSVVANLTAIGGSASQAFSGSGTTFSYVATVATTTPAGAKTLPVTVSDAQGRSATASINLNVTAPHIVISQIYGGGGNANATFTNDYVELFNPTANTVEVTGWSIQYGSASGSTWQSQPLGGVMDPGEYYLVKLASGGSTGAALPVTPNISGEINISASSGKIALVKTGQPLLGDCPTDPLLVDLVGYGSPNCWEGASKAPTANNTTAIFRLSNGSQDTDNNGADFAAGTPAPRRTAIIISEFGPWLSSTDPRSGGVNAPRDASITIDFSEPVEVDAGWYDIHCVTSGSHNDTTVASTASSKTFVITPNVNFQFGEQCTVTLDPLKIRDIDSDDSAPNTDTLVGAFKSWSFLVVGAGAAAPYAPSVHLRMGNPTNAQADTSQADNYLMSKPGYALSYNKSKGTPNWVSWHLEPSWFGNLTRFDTFRPDPAVPAPWYRVQAFDYQLSGFDRGHMVPNADRDNETRMPVNQETYLMSNMVPQAPDNNQGPWANLENYLRTVASAGNELYLIAGPAGVGGTGSNGFKTSIANNHVTVPSSTWKVAVVLPKADGDDAGRVTATTTTLAVIMPNIQGIKTTNPDDWKSYLTTIDAVEALTGFDLLSNIPASIQNEIQQAVYEDQRPSATISAPPTSAEGTAITATANVTDPDANELFTYAWTVTKNGSPYASGSSSAITFTPDDNGSYAVAFVVKDHAGATDRRSAAVAVTNVAPMVTAVSGPNAPLAPGTTATITAFFGDMGTADTHTAVFTWDDGSSSSATCTAGACTASHAYASAGVYGVTILITDDDGGFVNANFDYVVVADPNAGSVTGGGFVTGSGGRTSFAFNSAYLKGPKPQGNVEVQVQKNNFNFNATSMDWLVVAGQRAQLAGEGTVNGGGSYGYVLTAVDSDTDRFRIRIWDKTNGATVYDNVSGAPDDIDAANPQPLGGGSIVIHR